MLSHFKLPIGISIFLLLLAAFLGGTEVAFTVAVLSILEISLSIDNAVINASVLKNWDHKWRQYFLVFGLPFAVFGMRLIFPLLIVGISAGMMTFNLLTGFGMFSVLNLAIDSPLEYAKILTDSHEKIMAFGGSFLLMVFFKFFMDKEKDVHWVRVLEEPLQTLTKLEEIITILVVVIASTFSHDSVTFIFSGIYGVITFLLVKQLGSLTGGGTSNIVRQGIGGFLYLEMLDASFSFDGVIGAFAMSTNIFVIAAGLGIGALFIRELTIYLVNNGTMDEYEYLEHGAFWAIGILAGIMLTSVVFEVPEVVTGLLGASVLGLSLYSSIMKNKLKGN